MSGSQGDTGAGAGGKLKVERKGGGAVGATCGKKDKGEVDQWLQCEICEDRYHCEWFGYFFNIRRRTHENDSPFHSGF